MRKVAICFLVAVMAAICISFSAFSQVPAAVAFTYRGDINEDGQVNIFDLLELLKSLAGQPQTERKRQIADIDENGAVNIFDLLGLLKVLSGREQPGIIYWGPAISKVTPTTAGVGDTLGIECINFGETITAQNVKAILGDAQVGLLQFSRSYISIIVPVGFSGGALRLVVAKDTTNSVYVAYTISREMATETHQINSTVKNIIDNAAIESGDSTKIRETAESLKQLEGVKEVTSTSNSIFVEDKNEIMHVWMFDPLQDADTTALLSGVGFPFEPLWAIQNKRAILVNAIYEDPGFSYTKSTFGMIKAKLQQYGYAVDTVYGQKANIDFFKNNLKGAGFYFLLGHGGAYQEDFFHIQTGEEVPDNWFSNLTMRAKYGYDLMTKRISLATVEWGSGEGRKNNSKTFFSISNLAIENYYTASDFNGAFIYCAACQGLKNESMAKAFTAKGAATYAGWTETQSISVISGEKIVSIMGNGSTLKEVIDGLEERYKKQTEWGNAALKFYPVSTGGDVQFIVPTYILTGRILLGSNGFGAVTVNVNGNGVNSNFLTDINGNYSISGLANGTYTITPSKSEYTFSPQSQQVWVNGVNVTVGNFIATASSTSPGDTTVVQGITFVSIPGGTFQMGSTMYSWEQPLHSVTVSAFQMSQYEITNVQYAAYLNAALATGEIMATTSGVTGAKGDYSGHMYIDLSGPGDLYNRCWISYNGTSFSVAQGKEKWPVVYVTWYGAKAFAVRYGFDLPREAEWEYAARGGKGYEYGTDDGTISSTKANYVYDVSKVLSAKDVGSYPSNPFGLYDMSGNVWEWCNDWWYDSYSSASQKDPTGPSSGSEHVLRGGSWFFPDNSCRSACRNYFTNNSTYIGFRVVRRGGATQPTTYNLQGSILESGSGLAGVSMHITGNGLDTTITTASGGSYSFSGLINGTYILTPSKSGYTFSPDSQQVTVNGANLTVGNFTATASGGTVLPGDSTVVQGITFVSIPGGTFQMGTNDTDDSWLSHSRPVHSVTLDAFQIGRYEITQAQYQAVIGSNPSYFTGDLKRPVEQVSWFDVVTFCNKLSEQAGLQPCYNLSTWVCDFTMNGFRLPTEAEWEYACRAGSTTKYYTGDTESDLAKAGWYLGNSGNTTHTVGGKQANAFGLYDMHGNVWEWCNDWWTDYYTANSENNPQGPSTGANRVLRGGSCPSYANYCRSAERNYVFPNYRLGWWGFRVVRR